MLLKTNPVFIREIQDYGCYLFSLLWVVEKTTGRMFTPQEINDLLLDCKSKGWIGSDCTILDATKVFQYAGGKGRVLTNAQGRRDFPANTPIKLNQYAIQCWYNAATKYNHFVNGTPPTIVYDSLGLRPDGTRVSKTVREGVLQSLRIVELS